MGSQTIPHQGSNKADALSAELQGLNFNGSGMLPPATDLVNRVFSGDECAGPGSKSQQKEIAHSGDLFRKKVTMETTRPRESVLVFPRKLDDRSTRHQ